MFTVAVWLSRECHTSEHVEQCHWPCTPLFPFCNTQVPLCERLLAVAIVPTGCSVTVWWAEGVGVYDWLTGDCRLGWTFSLLGAVLLVLLNITHWMINLLCVVQYMNLHEKWRMLTTSECCFGYLVTLWSPLTVQGPHYKRLRPIFQLGMDWVCLVPGDIAQAVLKYASTCSS